MNLNASPSSFPMEMELISSEDPDQHNHPFGQNNKLISSSSSSSVACHMFFNPTQDQTEYFHHQSYQSQHQEDDNYASHEIKNKVENSGVKLSLWKKEDGRVSEVESEKNINPMKWMSSKMRLMQKMKNPDRFPLKITSNGSKKLEDHNLQPYSSLEIDLSNNNSSYNSTIRVCADCNTTKTPLWRSGPKGPKSLCNACGIRQRKARRAMAAAAAAASSTVVATDQPPAMKLKVQHKEKTTGKNGHASQLKKRYKMAAAGAGAGARSPSIGQKKLGFEDFLINLSKNLTFHRVFPEDEKDAAILLMALSSGLVHG